MARCTGLHAKGRGNGRLRRKWTLVHRILLGIDIIRIGLSIGVEIGTGAWLGRGRVDSIGAVSRERYAIRSHRIIIVVKIATTDSGHQGTIGRIVEVLGLFAHTIVTCILQTSLDTSLTRPLVT